MGEAGGAFLHDPFDLPVSGRFWQIIKVHGLSDCPEQAIGIIGFQTKSRCPLLSGDIQVGDGVMNPAGVVGHRQRSIDRGDHLGQAAGLEA